ncbi:MAG TPA: serine/threonine-protein kinase [Pirellulales bacterium]|nr:serine/threonine-protein kinase [Pirellulales bacterium]
MTSTPEPTNDAKLAELLERCQQADVDAVAGAHPELADELRSLWQAMRLADQVAAMSAADNGAAPSHFGDYEILEELGRGGMGVVYKARQRGLGRVVALKAIRYGAMANPAELARFRHEAAAAAKLVHPHVVPVYEVGECNGQPYFTMQYVAGRTLAARLADGPLPPREAAELLVSVCEAIEAAHRQGLLHRDLKPSNILIDEQGRALVTDFGLAKQVEGGNSLTHTGAIVGTPAYMAPEQAAGNRGRVGPASDVYSLGAILYHMLTGRPPLQGASPMETVLMVLDEEPPPPRLLNPRADRVLEMIALKCLQKPPDLRYASAAALADDLRAYLADEPVAVRSGRFAQVVARWMGETHQATVLENWGLLWMWHSLALVALCVLTNAMQWRGIASPWPYVGLWAAGLGTWAAIFWALRRRAGPVTFVERQIAHVWAGSVISIVLLFPVELILGQPVLTLSPVLGLTSGCVFLVKAGMLSGAFYIQSAVLFATAIVMAFMQRWHVPWGITLFGLVSGACFFVPGMKYYRQRRDAVRS